MSLAGSLRESWTRSHSIVPSPDTSRTVWQPFVLYYPLARALLFLDKLIWLIESAQPAIILDRVMVNGEYWQRSNSPVFNLRRVEQ